MKNIYPLFFILLSLSLNAQTKTWLGPDGFWSDETKWAPEGVPTFANDVVIPTGTTLDIDQNAQAGSITVNAGATMDISANFNLGDNSIFEAGSIVDLVSGTIGFSSGVILTVNGMLNVTSEFEKGISGAGVLDVTSPGSMNFESGGTGTFSIGSAADLKISPTGVMNIDEDFSIAFSAFASSSEVINQGTINKIGGTGTTNVSVAYTVDNGVTNVESGTLNFSGNGNIQGGTYNVSESAEMIWSGTNWDIEGDLTGVLNGPLTMDINFRVQDGTTASLDFTSQTQVNWSGLNHSFPGTLINYSTISVIGNSNINNTTMINHGIMNLDVENGLTLTNAGAVLQNEEDGIIYLNTGTSIGAVFGPTGIFNAGQIISQAGGELSQVSPSVTNESMGIIDLGNDTLWMFGPYSGEGVLKGDGVFSMLNVNSVFEGHLFPGEAIGSITHRSPTFDFVAAPTTVYHLDINGTSPETEHDVLHVQDDVVLRGSFDINLTFPAQLDHEFVVMTFADTLINELPETVELSYDGNTFIFDVIVSETDVILRVVDIALGVDEEAFPHLSIGPNPTQGPILLSFGEYVPEFDIRVFDLGGKLLSIASYPGGLDHVMIDIAEGPGVYMMHINCGEVQAVYRVVKQ